MLYIRLKNSIPVIREKVFINSRIMPKFQPTRDLRWQKITKDKQMKYLSKSTVAMAYVLSLLSISGCGPAEGSPGWCEKMKNTTPAQWTVHQTEVYANKCVLGMLR
jgi:hypothetical protein